MFSGEIGVFYQIQPPSACWFLAEDVGIISKVEFSAIIISPSASPLFADSMNFILPSKADF
jgi:hypothetical protein